MTDAIDVIVSGDRVVEVNLGTAGPPGISAYQSAVNAGFDGTEAEWLAAIGGSSGLVALDPRAENILSNGPDGLNATPTWQTTDW